MASTPSELISAQAQLEGARCSPEGLWNCMTTSFQRCTSGAWSEPVAMAPGTECYPTGVTVDFQIGFSNGQGSGVDICSSMVETETTTAITATEPADIDMPSLTPYLLPSSWAYSSEPSPLVPSPSSSSSSSSWISTPANTLERETTTPTATVQADWGERNYEASIDVKVLVGIVAGMLVGWV
ncbi:hypothetical protein CFIMG_008365RA00001 [Ceratocystis fimbriata CBS 114723]|uniref:Uncharacterized protein n=1 Tax=Ceratocystis fimbriata CBS 114723 TaxID=1035309 RepID=A0A2C5WV38_9PEZI|nr:hypothetical protein CFIMG_008365RA00001 [Ceratocystis fimbriata CBS 114723]